MTRVVSVKSKGHTGRHFTLAGVRVFVGDCSLLGVCFAIYFFSTGFDFLAIASGVSLARLIAVALIVVCLFNARNLRFERSSACGFLFALMGVALIPLLLMDNPQSGINPLFSLELSVVIAFFALCLPFKEGDVKLCEFAMVAVGLVMCVLLFVSPGAVGTEWVSDRVVVNIAGSQQDPNEFCGYMLFAVSLLTYTAVKRQHWWNLALVVVIFYCVLLTGSRGGLIANTVAFVAAFCVGFKQTNRRMVWAVLAGVLMFAVVVNIDEVLASLPPSVAERFTGANMSSGTASFRTQAWEDVLTAYISSDPIRQIFGHGYGATTQVTFNGLVAHNSYVEVLYTFGLAGLVCYLGSVAVAVVRALHASRMPLAITILAFLTLLMTLSAYPFKPFWAVIAIALMARRPRGDIEP